MALLPKEAGRCFRGRREVSREGHEDNDGAERRRSSGKWEDSGCIATAETLRSGKHIHHYGLAVIM